MSWSVSVVGRRENAKTEISTQFDNALTAYADKPDGADILAAKVRVLALIDAMELSSGDAVDWNAVRATAHGSHTSTPSNGLAAGSFSVSVERTHLAL